MAIERTTNCDESCSSQFGITQDSEQFPCRVDRFVELNPLLSLTPLAQRWALDEIGHDIGLDLNLLPPMLIGFQY